MESGTWETTHFQASPSSSGGGAVGHGLILDKETLIKKMPQYKTWADLQSFSRLVLRGGRQQREEPTGREKTLARPTLLPLFSVQLRKFHGITLIGKWASYKNFLL